MLLRICLILAILAGLGVIAVSQFQVKPHIQSIIDFRDNETKRANTAEKSLKDTRAKLATTEKTLAATEKTLGETKTQLEAAIVKATEQEKRAAGLQQDLDRAKQALNEADQELSRWRLSGLTSDQVKETVDQRNKLRDLAEVYEAEKKVLSREVKRLKDQLMVLIGDTPIEPILPPVKGTVLVVDPKWDFVVLDVGEKQNMVTGGVLMVSRNNKLVAKVKITSVQPDRCIANVMPGWKLDEVLEGDQVIN